MPVDGLQRQSLAPTVYSHVSLNIPLHNLDPDLTSSNSDLAGECCSNFLVLGPGLRGE